MRLYQYIIRRLIFMVAVLLGATIITFYLTRGFLGPETALAQYISPDVPLTDSAKLSLAQGVGVATSSCPSWTAFIDRSSACIVPLWQQYFDWLAQAFQGRWGYSTLPGISDGQSTLSVFQTLFPFTVELAVAAGVLTILVSIPLGVLSATHYNRAIDHFTRGFSIAGYSLPTFWFAYILQIFFVLDVRVNGLGLLPSSGTVGTTCALCFSNPGTIHFFTGFPLLDALLSNNIPFFWDSAVSLALPAITLALASMGILTRIVRSSMLEVLRSDYITLARSKGLKERIVVYRHALGNAMLPVVTITGLLFAFLLGGVVVIEFIFAWPGVGNAAYVATTVLDVNFIQLYVLVSALIIVVTNLVVDIIYAVIDPRVRY